MQLLSRKLKRPCGLKTRYRAILICAVCLCAFAFVVMLEYTFEYKRTNLRFNASRQTAAITTQNVNIVRFSNSLQIDGTHTQTQKKTNSSSLTVTPAKQTPKIAKTVAPTVIATTKPKTIYPVTLERNYVLENPNLCSSVRNLSVLVIIHTAPDHFDRRQNIRSTYANATFFRHFGTLRVLFLLGRVKDASLQDKIITEFNKYGDILQGDYIDAYRNLTHKGVMAYKWIQERCRNAKVVLKADDDVIVNMYKLFLEYLPALEKKSKTILCNHIRPGTMLIIRDKKSKWYVKENEFKGQRFYPRYCSGFFVMITNDAIPAIYKSAFITPFFWVDDVYLYGLLPSKVQGITYTGLKHNTFNLGPGNALNCYKNASKVCNYLVVGASRQDHVTQIWKYMTEQYQQTLHEITDSNTLIPGMDRVHHENTPI